MLAHSHALSGFAAGAATLPMVPATTFAEELAWVCAVGGFAMLPDLDSGGITTRSALPRLHGSTVAVMWGPITCLTAEVVSRVAGGHRNGTHSLLGTAVLTGLAALASLSFPSTLLLLALAIGLGLRSLAFAIPGRVEETWISNLALSFLASWWLLTSGDGSPEWLAAAVGLGCATHIAGDLLTTNGVPLLYPVAKGRQTLSLFRTGAWIEKYVVAPAFLALACWLLMDPAGGEALVTW